MPPVPEQIFTRLRLRQLELVCLLSETGNMRMASEQMHVSTPALSKSLREVEELAGADLFARTSRGMRLTSTGEAFVRHARAILERVQGLQNCRHEASGLPTRTTFRLGTAPFVSWKLVPPALQAMSALATIPRVQLVEGRIIPLAEQLVHGDLDAVLTLFTPEALEVFAAEALVLEQIHAERMFIVTGPADRGSSRKSSWKKLAGRDWILPPTTYTARILVQRAFLEAGLLPPEPLIESINIPAMLALVRSGLGVASAFESTVSEDLGSGALRRIRMERELPSVPIGLAYRKATADLSAVHALRDILKRNRGGAR
jgi:DNA-binding transcriptional LysR family regulator